jgi:uncharacterized protein YegP (UPF0339 family)/chaperonin cofactor prefoldin
MTHLFIQLAQSVTGAVITIVLLLLVAAIIGYLTAWFYSKSIYKPIIKGLEDDKAGLNKQVNSLMDEKAGLNKQVDSLKGKNAELDKQVDNLKEKNAELDKQVDNLKEKNTELDKQVAGLKLDITKLNDKVGKLNVKTAKPEAEHSEMNIGSFVASKAKNGEDYFNLQSVDGHILLRSEMYTTRAACYNGIESVRKNCQIDKRYDRKVSSNNKHYFNLKAINGQVIGTSDMFDSAEEMENIIGSVKMNGITSTLVENIE